MRSSEVTKFTRTFVRSSALLSLLKACLSLLYLVVFLNISLHTIVFEDTVSEGWYNNTAGIVLALV